MIFRFFGIDIITLIFSQAYNTSIDQTLEEIEGQIWCLRSKDKDPESAFNIADKSKSWEKFKTMYRYITSFDEDFQFLDIGYWVTFIHLVIDFNYLFGYLHVYNEKIPPQDFEAPKPA